MKTNYLITIALSLLIGLPVMGQEVKRSDYQLIHSNDEFLFVNSASGDLYLSLRVKNHVVNEKDSIFYFPMNLLEGKESSMTCDIKSSWLGKKAILKPNGDHILFTHTDEEILLRTHAPKGDTWIAYQSVTGDTTGIATVTEIKEEDVLGLKDSVKTIILQVQYADHSLSPNCYTVSVGKKYGLVRCSPLRIFPDVTCYYMPFGESYQVFSLAGASNPQRGVTNITWKEVYNFGHGDEMHYEDHDSWWGYDPLKGHSIYGFTEEQILICLGKYVDIRGYLAYDFRRQFQRTENGKTQYICDTLTLSNLENTLIDLLPGEVEIGENGIVYCWEMGNKYLGYKTLMYQGDLYLNPEDSTQCHYPIKDGINSSAYYYRGLGSFFGSWNKGFAYYKKGNIEWGTPLIISSTPEVSAEKDIVVTSQENTVWITAPSHYYPIHATASTLQGVRLASGILSEGEEKLEINRLPDTPVILFITSKEGKSITVKIQ